VSAFSGAASILTPQLMQTLMEGLMQGAAPAHCWPRIDDARTNQNPPMCCPPPLLPSVHTADNAMSVGALSRDERAIAQRARQRVTAI
jgi:hypothetical protein